MINIICTVIVIWCVPSNNKCTNVTGESQLVGHILGRNMVSYIVDFSDSAKNQNLVGNYRKVTVAANKCEEL